MILNKYVTFINVVIKTAYAVNIFQCILIQVTTKQLKQPINNIIYNANINATSNISMSSIVTSFLF